ncbi:MAG: interleukin-like EMT inducer domain-containing protein [Bacteroidales bacterium]|nr:interleukin-like EMT inducer domain-containing protein [Bacteroidales bacterium]
MYISKITHLNLFRGLLQNQSLKVSLCDSLLIFYTPEKETDILKMYSFDASDLSIDKFLETRSDHFMFIAVKDEATLQLQESSKEIFRKTGIPIDNLGYRGSLAAVIYNNKCLFYNINNTEGVEIIMTKDSVAEGFRILKDIVISSQGYDAGNNASVMIDNIEYCPNQRGFNMVVTDTAFNVVEVKNFDTHQVF